MAAAASLLLVLFQAALLFFLGYQYFLLLASVRQPEPERPPVAPRTRFAVAIPAHDEAAVLAATLARLREQDYPPDLFDVHVVADHCTDDTAALALREGARAHVRDSLPGGRKAYALRWLLDRILAHDPPYGGVAIFDADSLVDPGFLRIADAHLQAGARVLQGQHLIGNPRDSLLATMAAVDMRLNNRLRNQSRSNLGLACRLMGDAMVFDARVLREHGWLTSSLAEDREYGYELVLRGIRAAYVPRARSYGQGASTWKQARPQRLRWYQAIVAMQRRLAGPLLAAAARQRSLVPLDAALELLTPSYSFLAAASALDLGLVWALSRLLPSVSGLLGFWASALLLAAWGLYPLLGLVVDRAPAWAFKSLLVGPVYLAWRLWISILVRLRAGRITWIRTSRREETSH